jgi:hypothetical protein
MHMVTLELLSETRKPLYVARNGHVLTFFFEKHTVDCRIFEKLEVINV